MIKKVIGILISAYAVFLGIINYSIISANLMVNGDTIGRSFYPGSMLIFKICIFFSVIMFVTGILLFFNLKFSMEMYFVVMLAFIATTVYMEPALSSFRIFTIPAALGILLLLFNRKKAYAYNEINRKK